jgi:hypothetical protein
MSRPRSLALWCILLLAASAASATHHCFPQTLLCGETRNASLDATECFVDERSWADLYTFNAAQGQTITITMTASNYRPEVLLFDPRPDLVSTSNATGDTLVVTRTLESSGTWRIGASTSGTKETGSYTLSLQCSKPALPSGPFLTTPEIPDFRFKVRIGTAAGKKEDACLTETLCVSGAVAGRTEVLIRVVGPKPNGLLWPTIVKLNTTQTEVWAEQISTGDIRYYLLPGAGPTSSDLPGFFDRNGFHP